MSPNSILADLRGREAGGWGPASTDEPGALRQVDLALVTTSPLTLWAFFRGQVTSFLQAGLKVEVISGPGPKLAEFASEVPARAHSVPFVRRISPVTDLCALLSLCRLLRRLQPAILHTHTPKAGLLGMIAGRLAGVKTRIYTISGLVLMTRAGWQRAVLRLTERLACKLATEVLCVSHSLHQVALDMELCPPQKIRTLGYGGSHGVNLARFNPDSYGPAERATLRARFGIPEQAFLLAYVGRIVRDKGIEDLAAAWRSLRAEFPAAHLLLCGACEAHDPISREAREMLEADPRVHWTGQFIDVMPSVYAAVDAVVLPSYREGLPNIALEAAAMRVPIVATRISGCVDAVQDEVTGLLVEPRNVGELAGALRLLIGDPSLRQRLGRAARDFVQDRFSEQKVTGLLLSEYRRFLAVGEPPVPRVWAARMQAVLKRALDIGGAISGLLATGPFLLLAAAAVRLSLGSPVIFRSRRAGQWGREFVLFKLRTMTEARGPQGNLLPDDERLTALGSFLRKTSVDELPQLWNVLKGDMSLVGPRPLLPQYLSRYTPDQRRRHEVKPGITGWAQVNGRNALTWERKFELDVWYVDHWTIRLDITILWLTLLAVARRDGISGQGHATMPEFMGEVDTARRE